MESAIDKFKPSTPILLFVETAAVADAVISLSHEHDTDGDSDVIDRAARATHDATLVEHVSVDSENDVPHELHENFDSDNDSNPTERR